MSETQSLTPTFDDLSGSSPTRAGVLGKAPRFYHPELDVLRFFAFLAVFLFHGVLIDTHGDTAVAHPFLFKSVVAIHSTGRFGLSLFFVLSSYLITSLLCLEQERTGTVHLRSFYVRRILRIWPLYFVFLFGTYALGHLWSLNAFSWKALLAYSLLSGNWYAFVVQHYALCLLILWSISVEEQFYLIWPSLIRHMSRARMRAISIGIIISSLCACYIFSALGENLEELWYNSAVEALFFGVGALLALQFGLKHRSPSVLRTCLGGAVCFGTWVSADQIGFTSTTTTPMAWTISYLLAALGAASLLWGFLYMPRYLVRPELVYLGRISYGLYVFHGFYVIVCRHLVKIPHVPHSDLISAFLLTAGSAALSYKFLEKPFLKLKSRFEFVHSRAA